MGSSSAAPLTPSQINNLILNNESITQLQSNVRSLQQNVQANSEQLSPSSLSGTMQEIITSNTDVHQSIIKVASDGLTQNMVTVDQLNTEYGIQIQDDTDTININKVVDMTAGMTAKFCNCNQ